MSRTIKYSYIWPVFIYSHVILETMEDKNQATQENYLCSYCLQIISRFGKFWSAIFKEKVIYIEWGKLMKDRL